MTAIHPTVEAAVHGQPSCVVMLLFRSYAHAGEQGTQQLRNSLGHRALRGYLLQVPCRDETAALKRRPT